MKQSISTLLCIFLFTGAGIAQENIIGSWYGILDVQGTQLTLVFHIEESDTHYKASFDSPDQGATGIPFSDISLHKDQLKLTAANIGAVYEARFTKDSLLGTWTQGLQSFPLNMSRDKPQKRVRNRPQEPQPPYPYYEEEVTFLSTADSITLAGTLTLPQQNGQFPAVVLISGSGPQNRNQEVFGHRTFLVLADYLTRNGIAVLRYDDRGTAASTGNYSSATFKEFTADVLSAVQYLESRKEIDTNHIGLIGHSEGGVVAPMAANRDSTISFIVMLAGTGIPGKEVSLTQMRTLSEEKLENEEVYLKFFSDAIDIATSEGSLQKLQKNLTQHYRSSMLLAELVPSGMDTATYIRRQVNNSLRPWARYYYTHDPASELRKLRVPVLSVIGTNDRQVPAGIHHPAIRKALETGPVTDFTLLEPERLNHMFQESTTGHISEYAEIEQTFAPHVLKKIAAWIRTQIE